MKKYFLSIIFLMGLPLTVWGQFTLSGSIITQTGSATDLTGLNSITGVTTSTEDRGGGQTKIIYTLSGRQLEYDDLTFDATKEKLIFNSNCPAKRMYPKSSTSSLTINAKKTFMGNEIYVDEEAIVFLRPDSFNYNNTYLGYSGDFYINQGSFTWNGGTIKYSACVEISVGTVNKGKLVSFGNGARTTDNGDPSSDLTTSGQVQLEGGTYNDLEVVGGNYVIIENSAVVINKITTRGMMRGIEINVDDVEVANFDSEDGFSDMGIIYNKRGILKNPAKDIINVGGHVYYANNATHSINRGALKRYKESRFQNVKNGDNTSFDGVYYIKDYNNGNRASGYFTEGLDDLIVQGTITGGNSSDFNVITGLLKQPTNGGGNTIYSWDYRGKNGDGTHIFDTYLLSYLNNIGSLEQYFGGIDRQDISFLAVTDSNITETTQATVDAYTEIDNLDKLYDRAKSWKVSSTHVTYPTIDKLLAIPDGNTLDLEGRDLVIDASASAVFGVNTSTHVITLKATAVVTGNRFMSITTTGTVSFQNSATAEFGYEDSNGKNKYVQLDGLSNVNIEIVDTSNSASHTIVTSQSSFTGDYKTHFIFPSGATEITVRIKSPSGYTLFSEVFPDADLNFIRNNVTINISEEKQTEMLNLSKIMLAQSAVVVQALSGSAQTLTVTNTVTTSQAKATVENQDAILKMLQLILKKVTMNREVVRP